MLSYRHGFHAGSFADVLKHAAFVHALRHAVLKPKPIYVLDTHAGAGSYDLRSAMAGKTGEFRAGIGRVLEAGAPVPEFLVPYLDLVRAANLSDELQTYLNSPSLARAVLRAGDRLELIELHGTDHAALAGWSGGGATVRREDGLAALVHRLPPRERRAVILVDPSYEMKSDYDAVPAALALAHRRFATGTYLLWYPVIERARSDAFLARLRQTGIRRQFRLELCIRPDSAGRGMTGAGLVMVNPAWTLPAMAAAALPWLADALGAEGPITSEWMVPPETSETKSISAAVLPKE